MEAKQTNLLNFLRGPKQYIIPVYQRTYSWTVTQCQQLWDDISRVAQDEHIPAHFIGSVVYINEGIYQVSAVPRLLIIDGQQRLTTLSLLLAALGQRIKQVSGGSVNHMQIRNYYLINNDETGDYRHKLILTRGDRDTLLALIDEDCPQPTEPSPRLAENLRFFQERIAQSKLSVDDIYRGISKLIIVDVSLDRNYDNPQLIFESLNSTGLDLSQSDLIRNFVLMGLTPEHQNQLYNRYWYPIESQFGQNENASRFDFFMRDYLTLKYNGQIPTLRDVYKIFKAYTQTPELSVDDLVADVYNHAMVYLRFISPEIEKDRSIQTALEDIKTLKMDVVYPFLLEVFLDQQRGLLTRDEVLEILKIVESYVFRRAIVGIPTNSMNKTFATLSRTLDKNRYLESVKAAFLLQDSYRRFPDDHEFEQEFVKKDVYNFRSRTYLLSKLENLDRKEPVNLSDYTIEHIMPQNPSLSAEWQLMLGENWKDIQTQYLHTIGNLTLTGYNSELSDRSFAEKRDMEGGFRDSPIRLNRDLRNLEDWHHQTIEVRARELAELAKRVWAYPALPDDILASFRVAAMEEPQEYTVDHFDMQGNALDLFTHLRRHILNLDPAVREEPKKLYIAYKTTTNFIDIIPQKSRLNLVLNMPFSAINDPKGISRNVANLGRWGNGEVEISYQDISQTEDVMFLVKQSFDLHDDDL
ncbi:MAG: DUF262 domain-containing protein [Anaerolineae bacterium]|nr:DUF262 domain-containing protein [Anaerolineae bacterium]